MLAFGQPVLANGGTIQLSRAPAGPYEVTVLTSPSPLTVGVADVSVLVQRPGADEVVSDARVTVGTEPLARAGPGGSFEATHEQATNKLFYAANVELPTAGRWRFRVHVTGPSGEGAVSFEAEVAEAGLLDQPLVLLILVLPLGAAAIWWLARSGRKARSTGRTVREQARRR